MDLYAKAIIETLPDTLIEKDADTNEYTLVTVKAASLLDRLVNKLLEAVGKTFERRLGNSEGRTTN